MSKMTEYTLCENCHRPEEVSLTHPCERCGATLCPECICEDCENGELEEA